MLYGAPYRYAYCFRTIGFRKDRGAGKKSETNRSKKFSKKKFKKKKVNSVCTTTVVLYIYSSSVRKRRTITLERYSTLTWVDVGVGDAINSQISVNFKHNVFFSMFFSKIYWKMN